MQSAKTQFNIDVTGQTITIMATSTCHQYIGAVPFISIEKMLITNWQYNREADENRVVEITKYIKKKEKIDGIIYLAIINEQLVCYDGGHRLAAAKHILGERGDVLHYSPVLISFMFVDEEGTIIDHFKALNQCVSIPEIYTSADKREDKRKVVIAVYGHYKVTYPTFFVGSTNPQLPHENKSGFETKLGRLYDDLEEEGTCKNLNKLETYLKILGDQNEYYKVNVPRISGKRMQKCIGGGKGGFYLFAKREWAVDAFDTYKNKII